MDTSASKTYKYGNNHRGTASGVQVGVRHASNKVTEGTTWHRLPTYKFLSVSRFTNASLAMLVMTLLYKDLGMKAD